MTISATDQPRAVDVEFDADSLVVTLSDGRKAVAPLVRFPRLKSATPEQRLQWTLSGGGLGIHWEALDEDLSVPRLAGERVPEFHPDRMTQLEFVRLLRIADSSKNWNSLLDLARRFPNLPAPAENSWIRGKCHFALGDFDSAAVYMAEAATAAPHVAKYLAMAIWMLDRAGDLEGAMEFAKPLLDNPKDSHPKPVIMAASVMLHRLLRRPENERSTTDLPRIVALLQNALQRHNSMRPPERKKSLAVFGFVELGIALDLLGSRPEAIAAVDRAIELAGRVPLLLQLRDAIALGDNGMEQSEQFIAEMESVFADELLLAAA